MTKERARWASGVIVRNGDRLFINNDRGELIIVKTEPDRYEEIGRTPLIKPTSPPQNRRELVNVNWIVPRIRQPAHLRPERRRDHLRVARGGWPLIRDSDL